MANGIEAGRAFMRLLIDDKQFRRGLDGAARRMKSFGAGITNIGARIAGVGASLAAPLAGAVKFASEAEETFSKFDTVFGSSADAVREWGDALAKEVGRSRTEVAGFAAGFQDLLVPIGIDPDVARESSKQLTQLAIDLASFNNQDDADAVRDLQAALTGSSEVMKKYGVIVNEAAVKQELLSNSIDPKAATEQQKVFARLNIIMAGTTAAQGDAVRTANSFANSMKSLFSAVRDAGEAIGSALLAPLASVARVAANAVESFETFAKQNADAVRFYALAAAGVTALGVALVGIGITVGAAGAALAGFSSLLGVIATAAAAIVSPVGLAVTAMVGLGVAIVKYTSVGATALNYLKRGFRDLAGPVLDSLSTIKDALAAGDLQAAGKLLMAGLQVTFLVGVAKIKEIWAGVQGFIVGLWYDVVAGVGLAMGKLHEAWATAVGFMRKFWAQFTAGVQTGWATAQNYVTKKVLELTKLISELLTGEDFDISVELNLADGKLRDAVAKIDKDKNDSIAKATTDTNKKLAELESSRAALLEGVDLQERERRAAIKAWVDDAQQAVREARGDLAAAAADVVAGRQEDEAAPKFAEVASEAIKGLSGAADRIASAGTFSGRAAAAALSTGVSAADQRAERQRESQLKELRNIAKGVKKPAALPVVA